MRFRKLCWCIAVGLCAIPVWSAGRSKDSPTPAQGAAKPSEVAPQTAALEKKVEDYLRNLYGWDETYKLSFGPVEPTGMPEIVKVTLTVSSNGQSQTGTLFVSKDGKFMFRGDMEDLTSDPLATVRTQIKLDDAPSRGPAAAKIVVVEYADFQCPVCRTAEMDLRQILPNHPDVRFVFKDYPLVDIHPWAMTAAIAGRCAYRQNSDAFWRFHDLIYDNQSTISTVNAWDKMQDYAAQAGVNADDFRACMSDPKAQSEVGKSIQEGQNLQVANTPTFFINGRRMVGLDAPSFVRALITYHNTH
ncbi:MAG TPA: thioredoxin domain-containing protein [Candidatus Acidoferrales bacterium]|nr:thioredoxin domain-containing protein [Candidatus Acidoferrales bacterium]